MRTCRWWGVVVLAGCLLNGCFLTGCGGDSGGGQSGGAGEGSSGQVEPAPADGMKTYEAVSLPAVADPLRNLDGGKIELSPPAEWKTLPRNTKYVAAFVLAGANELPRILVKADDPPAGFSREITADNVSEAKVACEKALRAATKVTLLEDLRPVKIEGRIWLRHVRRVQGPGGDPAVAQGLQAIIGERLYQIDLYVTAKASGERYLYSDALKAHRDTAYAVAAHCRPAGSTPSAPAPLPGLPAPAEQPAGKAGG